MDCEMSATSSRCASKGNILINSQHTPTNRDAVLSKEIRGTSYLIPIGCIQYKVQGINGNTGHCYSVLW